MHKSNVTKGKTYFWFGFVLKKRFIRKEYLGRQGDSHQNAVWNDFDSCDFNDNSSSIVIHHTRWTVCELFYSWNSTYRDELLIFLRLRSKFLLSPLIRIAFWSKIIRATDSETMYVLLNITISWIGRSHFWNNKNNLTSSIQQVLHRYQDILVSETFG